VNPNPTQPHPTSTQPQSSLDPIATRLHLILNQTSTKPQPKINATSTQRAELEPNPSPM